jgi:hypothetical protein
MENCKKKEFSDLQFSNWQNMDIAEKLVLSSQTQNQSNDIPFDRARRAESENVISFSALAFWAKLWPYENRKSEGSPLWVENLQKIFSDKL